MVDADKGAVNDTDVGHARIGSDGIEQRRIGLLRVEGDGMIITVEGATKVGEGCPRSGHGQVGCDLVGAACDGLEGRCVRDECQWITGIAGDIAIQIGLISIGDSRAVIHSIGISVVVGVSADGR